MRHRKSGKKLGRNTSHRKAMMRNMVTSFFDCEKITTTDARAKELRKMAEKLITMARRGDLHSRRLVLQVVRDGKTVAKLFDVIAPRYADRPGGYTRIIKLGHRSGDNAALSLIELVEEEIAAKPKKKKAPAKKAAKKVEAPAEEAPAEEAPAEEAPAEEAPAEEAPAEEAPAEEAPAEEAPAEEAPAEEAPTKKAPAKKAPAKKAPAKKAAKKVEAPVEEAPAEEKKEDK